MSTTRDLSKFGFRELHIAARVLTAYIEDRPGWLYEGVAVEFNAHSGFVFLIDEDFNIGMLNDDTLEQWHHCSECGVEGFREDVVDDEHHFDGHDTLVHGEEEDS